MEFTEKTRKVIRTRAQDRCELCGTRCTDGQIHHRRPRGMGGTKNLLSRSVSNGLYVHFRCHHMIEMNRAKALENGWLIRQSDDPESEPVRLHSGWVVLNPDGSVSPSQKYQSPPQGEGESGDSIPPSSLSTSE